MLQRLGEHGGSTGLGPLIREILTDTGWDDRNSPEQLKTLLESGDFDQAEELVGYLIRNIEASQRQLSASVAWHVYRTLRDYKRYDVLQELTGLLLRMEPESARYASMHGVALAEAGKPSDAIELLRPFRDAVVENYRPGYTQGSTDLAMLEGALGQAYEYLYLNAEPGRADQGQRYLDHALESYFSAWDRHPATGFDLGVHALALQSHHT